MRSGSFRHNNEKLGWPVHRLIANRFGAEVFHNVWLNEVFPVDIHREIDFLYVWPFFKWAVQSDGNWAHTQADIRSWDDMVEAWIPQISHYKAYLNYRPAQLEEHLLAEIRDVGRIISVQHEIAKSNYFYKRNNNDHRLDEYWG